MCVIEGYYFFFRGEYLSILPPLFLSIPVPPSRVLQFRPPPLPDGGDDPPWRPPVLRPRKKVCIQRLEFKKYYVYILLPKKSKMVCKKMAPQEGLCSSLQFQCHI